MRPVFIGGSLRSGTTVLADLLGCHPGISPIYETDFVVNLLQLLFAEDAGPHTPDRVRATMQRFVERMPRMGARKRAYERFVHGNSHLRFDAAVVAAETERLLEHLQPDPVAALRTMVSRLFTHHAAQDGKPDWINKTPANLHFAPGLRVVFPDMLLIHVVRDGRDVAASAVNVEFGPRTVREAATWWVGAMRFAEDFARQCPSQLYTVRYEDLVTHPEEVVRDTLSAMGQEMPDNLVADWAASTGGLDPSRIGAWQDHFTTTDRAQFLSIAGAMLERHGYEAALPA